MTPGAARRNPNGNGPKTTGTDNGDPNTPPNHPGKFPGATRYFERCILIMTAPSYGRGQDLVAQVAQHLIQNPQHMMLVEGHCDERGTEEYNLSLGERRALTVAEELVRLGVSADRLGTQSLGEKVPCPRPTVRRLAQKTDEASLCSSCR